MAIVDGGSELYLVSGNETWRYFSIKILKIPIDAMNPKSSIVMQIRRTRAFGMVRNEPGSSAR